MGLDKLDRKILWHLDYNARMNLTDLADEINRSKQNVHYRIKKLKRDGVIKGFTSVVDTHGLGYLTYRVYLRYRAVDQEKEQEIIDYFKRHNRVLWFVSLYGSWDLEVVFVARNFVEFNNAFKGVKEDLGNHFSKYDVSMSTVNYHLKRDYLLNRQRTEGFDHTYYGFEPKQQELDELDIKILEELSKDCRRSNREIGKQVGVTYKTVKNRIEQLEEAGVIPSHRIALDISKLDRIYYKANIELDNPSREEEQRLYNFCASYNSVVYLVEVLGGWQFEIEAEVASQEEFTHILRDIRNEFPGLIRDYHLLHITDEHKLDYLPMGLKTIRA